jgi:Fe2+ transport system protein FeoA
MKLSELLKGDQAVITKITTAEALRTRLFSFGVAKGSQISVEACSLKKQTIEIEVDGTLIGLRSDEAKEIEVEKIA